MKTEQMHLPLPGAIRRMTTGGRTKLLDPSMHHLSLVNGVWCVRFTIDRGPKFVGDRIKISLGTADVLLAQRMRDKIIQAVSLAGAKIAKNNAATL